MSSAYLILLNFANFWQNFEWRLRERPFRIILSRSTAFLSALWARKAIDSIVASRWNELTLMLRSVHITATFLIVIAATWWPKPSTKKLTLKIAWWIMIHMYKDNLVVSHQLFLTYFEVFFLLACHSVIKKHKCILQCHEKINLVNYLIYDVIFYDVILGSITIPDQVLHFLKN